ncbi:hypothetical protein TKK_0002753 [Trichogramma kaykai]
MFLSKNKRHRPRRARSVDKRRRKTPLGQGIFWNAQAIDYTIAASSSSSLARGMSRLNRGGALGRAVAVEENKMTAPPHFLLRANRHCMHVETPRVPQDVPNPPD